MQINPTEGTLRHEMIQVCQRLYQKNFVSASDGNLSVRLSPERLLITPSGFSKGDIKENHLIIVDMNGKILRSARGPNGEALKVTTELRMHLEVYHQRPDVKAVVHAHPPVATGFSLAGVPLAKCLLPEVVYTLGAIPTTRFAAPTTEEVPESVRELIQTFDAIVLDRHGALTVGKDLWDAYYKLEKLEHTAIVMLTAYQLGSVREMTNEQRQKVIEVGQNLGVRPEAMAVCHTNNNGSGTCSLSPSRICNSHKTDSQTNESPTNEPSTTDTKMIKDTIRKLLLEEIKMQ
jgi:L-fuculose-phosphate aldolase